MKFIKSSYEIIPQADSSNRMAVLKRLERIGRVCYKSEDKITDESCIKFINNIKERQHWSILEHHTFVLNVLRSDLEYFTNLMWQTEHTDFINALKYINTSIYRTESGYQYIISGSATAFNNLLLCERYNEKRNKSTPIIRICNTIRRRFPELIVNPYPECDDGEATYMHILNRKEIESMPAGIRAIHDNVSVKYTVSRAIANEIVRHRPCSFAQESTRYVNYNNRGCEFIIPSKFDDSLYDLISSCNDDIIGKLNVWADVNMWMEMMKQANDNYNKLINLNWKPQEARSVLPQDTKTELVQTCNFIEWNHFFKMRCDQSAHPDMRYITLKMLKRLYTLYPELFKDQKHFLKEDEQSESI